MTTKTELKYLIREDMVTSQTDAAKMLGVTHQRVQQICKEEGLDLGKRIPIPMVKWECPRCRQVLTMNESQKKHRKTEMCSKCAAGVAATKTHREKNTDSCSITGCDQRMRARGWCQKHYSRWRNNGDPNDPGRYSYERSHTLQCTICGDPHYSKGLCRSHYNKERYRHTRITFLDPIR